MLKAINVYLNKEDEIEKRIPVPCMDLGWGRSHSSSMERKREGQFSESQELRRGQPTDGNKMPRKMASRAPRVDEEVYKESELSIQSLVHFQKPLTEVDEANSGMKRGLKFLGKLVDTENEVDFKNLALHPPYRRQRDVLIYLYLPTMRSWSKPSLYLYLEHYANPN